MYGQTFAGPISVFFWCNELLPKVFNGFLRRMCMKFVRTWLLTAVALFAVAALASAQTTNGTVTGHVADSQGLALPGVTVNASSPNLQGVRTVVTSENGDFVLSGLPSGTYTLSFE